MSKWKLSGIKGKLVACAIIILLSVTHAAAQKIKYKDLFPILDAKNYEEGGPQLFTYLSNPKNQDEANPNLQMGFLLEDRFLSLDVVDDSLRIYELGDSSILFLEKAKSLIDEKELKKRDEYYQAFFRRDLRTGEFGIKVSDVHLDIEKKVNAIQARMDQTRALNKSLNQMTAAHEEAMSAYRSLVTDYSAYNTLLIGADENAREALQTVQQQGRKAIESAEEVQKIASKLGSSKFTKEVVLLGVQQYGVDGMSAPEPSPEAIKVWGFESWGSGVNSEILGGVSLFKTMVSKYSENIRAKKKLIKNSQQVQLDSMSVELSGQFQTYDPQSTAKKLLLVEYYEGLVMKQVDLQLNRALMDSSLIGAQLKIFSGAWEDAKKMKAVADDISSEDLELMKKKYREYSDSFFQEYVAASKYLSDMQGWSDRQVKWLGSAVAFWEEKNKWGQVVDENGLETAYPLYEQEAPENGLMTMGVPIKNADEAIIYGANLTDGIGFVKGFGTDRYEKWKLSYDLPVDGAARLKSDTIPTINGSIGFYVHNTIAEENNFTVVSFDPSGQLNWATLVTLSKDPVAFKFDDLTQELTILLYPEEQLPLNSDELGYIVIDRTGNAR